MSARTTRHTGQLRNESGLSLVELTVAMGLLLVLVGSIFSVLRPADGMFAVQTESADIQQRLRAATDALRRDLSLAGAGGSIRRDAASLVAAAPSILPRRLGLRGADAPDLFRTDAITVIQTAPLPAIDTTLAQPMPAATGATQVAVGPGCPPDPSCGIAVDDDVLIADDGGAFDLFTVTAATLSTIVLRHNGADWPKVYPAGSVIRRVVTHTYFLRPATATRPPQLARYDGGSAPDVPVVDHVVGLAFEYYGEPAPPVMLRALSDAHGPWTSYGPRPPAGDLTVTPPIAGSSCLFQATDTPLAAPRLPFLAASGSALVRLRPEQLTDGPWCPDDTAPNRYDADLLRIRAVGLYLRVESALDGLRGPAGVLFARGGTVRSGDRYVPDRVVRTRITPVNLVAGR